MREFPNVLSGTCREEPYSDAPRQRRTILVLTTWAEQQPEQAVGGEVAGIVDASLLESCLISHPDCTFALANQEAIELSNSCWDSGQMPEKSLKENTPGKMFSSGSEPHHLGPLSRSAEVDLKETEFSGDQSSAMSPEEL